MVYLNTNDSVCVGVYPHFENENTTWEVYDSTYLTNAAVKIEGEGVEIAGDTVLLTKTLDSATVVFSTENARLTVIIQNYIQTPVEPEFVLSYTFHSESATIGEILESVGITFSTWQIVSVGEGVTVDSDVMIVEGYFDEALLTVALADETEVVIHLSNPAPIEAGQLMISEDGSFAADESVPAGTKLVTVELEEVDEETQAAVDAAVAEALGEEAQEVRYYDISLVAPDGEEIESGATVTVKVDLTLPEAPEGQVTKVKAVKVFHMLEDGTVNTLDATWTLGEGKISSVSFTTDSFSLFAVSYTVDFINTETTAIINLNFTGFVPYPDEEVEANFVYDTDYFNIQASVEDILAVSMSGKEFGFWKRA